MKGKMKKIALAIVLVVILVAIVFVVMNSSSGKKEEKVANADNGKLTATQNTADDNVIETVAVDNETTSVTVVDSEGKDVTVEELKTGTKYSVDDSIKKADIIVGDNYFGTQIADISLNFEQYEGKTIEIEGLYFNNSAYHFVGRYSTSAVCPNCPAGYSYFEYEWHGNQPIELTDSNSWIKVIGTLREGNDETGQYYYIDAESVEVMKTQGLLTVEN